MQVCLQLPVVQLEGGELNNSKKARVELSSPTHLLKMSVCGFEGVRSRSAEESDPGEELHMLCCVALSVLCTIK